MCGLSKKLAGGAHKPIAPIPARTVTINVVIHPADHSMYLPNAADNYREYA